MIADGSIALPGPTQPGSFTALMHLYESNYLRLHWLFEDVSLLPEIRYPTLTVQTELEGSAPVDVENLITRPLEEAVGVVPGVDRPFS